MRHRAVNHSEQQGSTWILVSLADVIDTGQRLKRNREPGRSEVRVLQDFLAHQQALA
jgi:hypothetical protein